LSKFAAQVLQVFSQSKKKSDLLFNWEIVFIISVRINNR